jgi:glycosyltransferase involved in cell wall biosynthesis
MEQPIPILYVINSLDIGGTEKQFYLLLKYLDPKRFTPKVICLSEGGYWIEPIRELGINLIELKRSGSFEFKRLIKLALLINNYKPHIIHTFQAPANNYGMLASAFNQKIKKIVSRRSIDLIETQGSFIKKSLNRLSYHMSDIVVCNSHALYDDFIDRYGKNINVMAIHNGIEMPHINESESLSILKQEFSLPKDSVVLCTVGRLVPKKNHRLFLDTAREVINTYPECYCLIVGDGPLKDEIHSYAKEIGIDDHVIFTGMRDDVIRILRMADIFIFPAFHEKEAEGLPNAVMEAMLCGVPSVVSRASGSEELFNDSEAGFIIGESGYMSGPGPKESYVEKALMLLHDNELRRKMSDKGKAIVKEKFSVQAMVNNFENLYDSLLRR